jgi:DNA-directed RNA polymerase subunit RPC12/RpoP
MTSDERIEIAERLRKAAVDDGHLGRPYGEQGFQVTLRRIISTSNPTRPALYARLAELSDPTCKPVGMNYLGNAPWHDGGVNLDASTTGCSVCGYPFGNGRYYIPGMPNTIPRYCPNCGSRVVMPAEERDAS